MRRLTTTQLIGMLGLLATGRPAGASLIPTSWILETGVQQTSTSGFTEQVFDFNTEVESPFFNLSQSAALGPSLSTAQYAFNIGETVANYVINVQHRCMNHQNGNFRANPRCLSDARIILTPSVDVLLTASSSYAYFMPSDPVAVSSNLSARLASPNQTLFSLGQSDSTDWSGPHGGTISLNAPGVILPAGRMATVQYSMDIIFFSGSGLGLLGAGDGAVHLTMTAVPEPAPFGSLSFAALVLFRRPIRR